MSYVTSVVICCDEADCDAQIAFDRENRGGMTKTWAGHLARVNGWWIRGGPATADPTVAKCQRHHPATLIGNRDLAGAEA